MKKTIVFGILVCLLILGCKNNETTGSAVADTVSSSDNYVSIPMLDISDQVKFYEYNDNGIIIKYFAVLGSDGEPRTAFDACDVCRGYKGYQQIGSDIECRKCSRVFSIDGLGTKNKGYGCWPSYLPHEIKGNEVIIKTSDIESGRHRFV